MTKPQEESVVSSEVDPSSTTSPLGNLSLGRHRMVQSGRQLFSTGLLVLASALCYYAFTAKVEDPIHKWFGLLIVVGSAFPALIWAKRNDSRFPVFEVFMLTGINTYAVPLLSGHSQLRLYPVETITSAGLCILVYQMVANLTYTAAQTRPKRTRFWTEEIITGDIVDYLGYGMAITTTYTIISGFTTWIPYDLIGPIRAVCYGVGIISTFLQCHMWGKGTLPRHRKGIFVFQIALQVIFSWAALFLIGGLSILILGLLGYVSGGKKIPLVPLVIVLPIVAVLHNGKSQMRLKYWEGGAPLPTLTEIPAFYGEWLEYGFSASRSDEEESNTKAGSKLLERTSLFHILCLVVDCTPARQAYLQGETYGYVLPQLIPSFFWHNKPPAHVATNRLSTYYGLQDENATTRTTIAFGMISEAYANFGLAGVAVLAATFAFILRRVSDWSARSPILSYPGLLLVILMAWSFQSELTMAAWVGSLYQACVAVLGVPFVMRNFLGR
jgi:hypothetical protein